MPIIISLLPTLMISKRILGSKKIDYESYLIELINSSAYFMNLTGGEKFYHIVEQAHGEADVKTSNYELDFKVLAPPTFVNEKLKALPAIGFTQMKQGFITVNDKINDSLTQAEANGLFVKFFCDLSALTIDDITNYAHDKSNNFYNIIKILQIKKNLLIFLPIEIECKYDIGMTKYIEQIKNILSLRSSIEQDTYIAVIRKYPNKSKTFFIFKYGNNEVHLVDKVSVLFMPYFNQLYRLTSFAEK